MVYDTESIMIELITIEPEKQTKEARYHDLLLASPMTIYLIGTYYCYLWEYIIVVIQRVLVHRTAIWRNKTHQALSTDPTFLF
jgi:hypothetical protein